jgi:hypothetical protein
VCASILMHSVFFVMLMAACRRWEFVTTLDFEWEVFTGRRPWKWSFAVYLTSRLLALMAVMCNFVGFILTIKFNCNVSDRSEVLSFGTDEPNLTQVWFRCILAASWFSVAIASFLLALRGQVIHGRALSRGGCRLTFHQKPRIAIWGRDKYITTATVSIWSANIVSSFWSAFDRFFWILFFGFDLRMLVHAGTAKVSALRS